MRFRARFFVLVATMSKAGPILFADDDTDDQIIFEEALEALGVTNKRLYFNHGQQVLDYLRNTSEKPLIIMSDINMPQMSGLQLRREIINDEVLRRKSIPFIFLTTSAGGAAIREAYDLEVQGFFEKSTSFKSLCELLSQILNYWHECRHPNN